MTTTQSCRAIDTSEASDRSWRGNLYDRARRTLASEMRARRPQPTQAEIARELAALEAAIKRIEAESARSGSADSDSAALPAEPDQSPLLGSLRWRRPVSIAFVLVIRGSLRFLAQSPAREPAFARAGK